MTEKGKKAVGIVKSPWWAVIVSVIALVNSYIDLEQTKADLATAELELGELGEEDQEAQDRDVDVERELLLNDKDLRDAVQAVLDDMIRRDDLLHSRIDFVEERMRAMTLIPIPGFGSAMTVGVGEEEDEEDGRRIDDGRLRFRSYERQAIERPEDEQADDP